MECLDGRMGAMEDSEYNDLKRRITAVESRLATDDVLRETEEGNNARTRKIILAHTEKLETIIETQAEHTDRFDRIDERFDRIEGALSEILKRLPPN